MSEGGGWVKWVGMQGYTVSHTVQNESTITFLGGVSLAGIEPSTLTRSLATKKRMSNCSGM